MSTSNLLVVKIGGGAGINWEAVCDDIAELQKSHQVVLIHGGSHQTNEVAEALGHPAKFITSPSGYTSRLTDRRTLEIFQMVYCGLINKQVVERLQRRGVNAIGLSGVDGGLWKGPRKKALKAVENGRKRVVRDSYTGKVEEVNVPLLHSLIEQGYLPVLTPPALSFDNEAINVDGDRAAAATAAALQAEQLFILSNVPGLLTHWPDEQSLLSSCRLSEIDGLIETTAKGRMRIKLLGAKEALQAGVKRVIIGDARRERPIQVALEGAGTEMVA